MIIWESGGTRSEELKADRERLADTLWDVRTRSRTPAIRAICKAALDVGPQTGV